MSFSPCPLSLGSLSLSSLYSLFLPSGSSLFSLLHLLPFLFLSISAYIRTLSPTSPALSLPSPAYSISSTFCPYSFYLPIPAPSTSLFPFRPQPILSPPPSTLTLPIYTHSLLPLASLFPPVPCLFPLSSTFYPYSSYLYPLPPPPNPALPSRTLPILSPLPLRTKGLRGTLSSLMGRRGGAGDSHIPLTPRGKSEGRDRNKTYEATYPLWGTSPRVYLWGRVRTWGNGGYFFAFFIPSR